MVSMLPVTKRMLQKLYIRRIYDMIPSQMENKKKRIGLRKNYGRRIWDKGK